MSHDEAALYHSNGYNVQAACEHCEGSSATSSGVRHLIQLFVTPTKLLSLPTNWRSETRLSFTH
jgi:hypothetical protein